MSDPLGLSASQRAHSTLCELAEEFIANLRANTVYLNSLPDDAELPCDLPACEIMHPVEMFR